MHLQPITGTRLPISQILTGASLITKLNILLLNPLAQNSLGNTKDSTRSHSCVNMLRGRLLERVNTNGTSSTLFAHLILCSSKVIDSILQNDISF